VLNHYYFIVNVIYHFYLSFLNILECHQTRINSIILTSLLYYTYLHTCSSCSIFKLLMDFARHLCWTVRYWINWQLKLSIFNIILQFWENQWFCNWIHWL